MSVHGLFFDGKLESFELVCWFKSKTEFGCGACAPVNSWSKSYPDDVGVHSGLTVDDAGFGAGACTTLVDPGSYPGGAELDDACASDDSTSFPHFLT
jgi:hypothetical protein